MVSAPDIITLRSFERMSRCKRAQVGAILIDKLTGSSIMGSYNGYGNVCKGGAPGECGCEHAEIRLLKRALNEGYTAPIYRLLISTSPCVVCAQAIIDSKIVLEVAYLNYYRRSMPITLLVSQGIACVKVNHD